MQNSNDHNFYVHIVIFVLQTEICEDLIYIPNWAIELMLSTGINKPQLFKRSIE